MIWPTGPVVYRSIDEKVVMTVLQSTTLATGTYRSYLVRFWQSKEQGPWRATVQCVQTSQTMHFGDIESLLNFLQKELGHPETGAGQEPKPTL